MDECWHSTAECWHSTVKCWHSTAECWHSTASYSCQSSRRRYSRAEYSPKSSVG